MKKVTKRACVRWRELTLSSALAAFAVVAVAAEQLPKVWMSAQWRDPFSETIRLCAEQGVDVVEVPSWTTNHCAYVLAALRKYKVKGFTSSGTDPSKNVPPDAVDGKTVERAVFTGGAYRGKAIDRTLFTFEPKAYDIVIEPPVYSARQGYTSKKKGPDGKMRTVRSGHYFGAFVPTGEAEIIVPEKLFDGEPHVRIIPCKVLPVEDGRKPEKDTVTDKMSGPEIENRRLVRLVFDLSDCKGLMLDKVGIAVYWASDTESDGWKQRRRGQLSVFSEHTRRAARENGARRVNQWVRVNGGTFPKDDIIAIRFGDECFNLTGWVDCPAASFPLWGFSPSGRAAFAREGRNLLRPLIQPRTWGYPEIYGAEAYGIALYSYHKACAELTRAFAEGVHSVAPSLKVFRNTTRGDAWSEGNDHDGSGQELLARELDFIHLDPYPVGGRYNSQTIPFDMGYLSGLARRYHKPLVPWMQAHSYAPSGLGNITPADMKRMWEQHAPFAPDAMMWLGFDMKPGKTDTEMTFPKGSPESWAYAKELFAEVHAQAVAQERDPPAGRARSPSAPRRPRRGRPTSAPFGTIPDSALSILKQGEWADYRDDPAARDGRAIRISNVHYGWCVTFQMDSVKFRPDRTYALKARVRVARKPGASGKAFWAGVYSNALRKGRGQITVKTDALHDDGYVWYTVAEWKPGREEYFWIGVGPFDKKNGSAAVESVWVDEILIEEKE